MKIQYSSSIVRYEGDFPSLSAFLMCPAPKENDSESFIARAEGEMSGDKTALSLNYKEEDGTAASLSYDGEELIFRRGATASRFLRAKTSSFSHMTDLGAMPISAYTLRLDVMEREGMLLLTLSAYMHVSGMVQKTTMKWKIS